MSSAGATPGVEKIDRDTLLSIIKRELDASLGVEGGKLSFDRRQNLKYYEGEPFGNEIEGRSQVVMLSTLEAVEWVLPALLRIFTQSDKVADFEPTRQQGEGAADQATSYCNYIFYEDNPGFMLLHDWFKDALIQKVGWLKCYWDDQKHVSSDTFCELTPQEADALSQGDGVEVVSRRDYPAPMPDFSQDGAIPAGIQAPMLTDLVLKTTRQEGRVKILPVPPEEVLTSRRARAVDTDLPFVCHRRAWLYSDLVEQGYDEDCLDEALGSDEQQYNTERVVRYEREDDFPFQTERTDKAAREIWTEESYIRVDWDGDGIAELNKVVTAGNARTLLTKNDEPDIEPLDEVPLIPICPVPMPHKLVGFGLADLVQDLQLIKSTLMRQMLDNLYLTNDPRHKINEAAASENTFDDLLTSRPGGIVRMKDINGLEELTTPFVAAQAMEMVNYIDQVQEVRTGVSRHNQQVDADIIQKSSSGINTHLIQQAAAQRVELIARIFAETGVKTLFKHILGLITKYQQAARVIRLTGEWVEMDPRHWADNMNVKVSVGLGTGNRDQILQHLMQLLEAQKEVIMLQKGINGPLVYGKNIYDVLERLSENAGFKESFFTDPTQPPPPGLAGPPQPPPPDPEAIKMQAQLQLQQQKAQIDQQNDQARLQADLEAQRQKAALDIQIAQQRAQVDMEIARQKAALEAELQQQREAAKIAGGAFQQPVETAANGPA